MTRKHSIPHHHHGLANSPNHSPFHYTRVRLLFLLGAFIIIVLFIILQERLSHHVATNTDIDNGKKKKKFVYRDQFEKKSNKHKPQKSEDAEDGNTKIDVNKALEDLQDDPHVPNRDKKEFLVGKVVTEDDDNKKKEDQDENEDDDDDSATSKTTKKANKNKQDPRNFFDYEVHLSDTKKEAILGDDYAKLFDHVDLVSVCGRTKKSPSLSSFSSLLLPSSGKNSNDKKQNNINSKNIKSQITLPRISFTNDDEDDHQQQQHPPNLHHHYTIPDSLMRAPLDLKKLSHHVFGHNKKNNNNQYRFGLWGNLLKSSKTKTIHQQEEGEEELNQDHVLHTPGIYCLAKYSSSSSKHQHSHECPESLGILVLPPPKSHNRDASEFGVFPFQMKSVHEIIDDADEKLMKSKSSSAKKISDNYLEELKDKSTLSCGAVASDIQENENKKNVAFLRCVKAKSKVADRNQGNHNRKEERDQYHQHQHNDDHHDSQNNKKGGIVREYEKFPSSTSDVKPFHIRVTWPTVVPSTNPVLPLLLNEESIDSSSVTNDNNKNANNKNDEKSSGDQDQNHDDQEQNKKHGEQQQQQEPRPTLNLARIEEEGLHSPSSLNNKKNKNNKHHPSEALGVLINGRGVSKLLLSSEDDEGEESKVRSTVKSYQGETNSGLLYETITKKKLKKQQHFEVVSLEKGFVQVNDEETFLKNIVADDAVPKTKPILLHITASLVISSSHTLHIPPGTVFAIDHARSIEFKCPVEVHGSATRPVLFTSSRIDKNWGGLVLSSSSNKNKFHHTIITNTGGVRSTIKGVGTHIKDACPAIVVRPGVSLDFIDNSAIISGKGSGITSGKDSKVLIQDAMLFDLAQGGEFVGSDTKIIRTHALHFMLREHHDDFLDLDNDGFYFRDGTALVQKSVIFGSRDDCIDTASSKNKRGNDGRNSSLIILNSVLANCQHEGVALSGSVGIKRNVEIVDTLVTFAQQGIENGHTPSTHVTVLDGVAIEDCGIGLRLGDNYILDVDGVVDLAGDVEFNRCTLPVLNLLRNPENKHKNWQLDGNQQGKMESRVRISPRAIVNTYDDVDGSGHHHLIGKYRTFCGREMFAFGADEEGMNKIHDEHEVLGIL